MEPTQPKAPPWKQFISFINEKINGKPDPIPPNLVQSTNPERVIRSGKLTPTIAQRRDETIFNPFSTPTPTSTPTEPITPQITARNPNYSKYNPQPVVVDAITRAAKQYDMDPSILFDVALQESSFNPNSINKTTGLNDSGLFQFTDSTWQTVKNYANMPGSTLKLPSDNRLDPYTNALAAAYLIAHGQLGRWNSSKNVWGQYYKPEELQQYYSQTL